MPASRRRHQWLLPATSVLIASALAVAMAADRITWKTRGPGGGGNYFAVGVSPVDANTVLMGSDTGGIFRTTDGGATWKLVNDGLIDPKRFGAYDVEKFKFTFDSLNPSIVYAGTLKSSNAGANWHETQKTPYIITWVNAIDPGNHNNVYAAGYNRVYRSNCAWDGAGCDPLGPTCSELPGGAFVSALVLDPSNANHVIACTDHGIYQSLYSGSSHSCDTNPNTQEWSLLVGNLPFNDCNDFGYDAAGQKMFTTVHTHTDQDCTGWNLLDTQSWKGGIWRANVPGTGTTWGSITWSNISGADDPTILGSMNPGFETGPDAGHPVAASWNVVGGTVTRDCGTGHGHDGSSCSMKLTMSPSGGGIFQSDAIPVQTPGVTYRVSAWVYVDYPTGGGTCPHVASGCTLGTSFHLRYYSWKDAAGTDPLPDPGYESNNQNQIQDSVEAKFDPAFRGGWRLFETEIPARTGAASIRLYLNTDGTCAGNTWVDDVSLSPVHNLARAAGYYPSEESTNYGRFVVDPTNSNILYTGTQNASNYDGLADVSGVYKTTDGGTTWSLMTRSQYQDNVLDGYLTGGSCNDKVCNGRGETCTTCPEDCTAALNPQIPSAGCCGDNVCATGEHGDNPLHQYCYADCPVDADPNRNVGGSEYFDASISGWYVWGLGIGSGAAGHNTVYFGSAQAFGSTNAGGKWKELSSDPQNNSTVPNVTWKQRGDANAVVTFSLATDSRAPSRLYYCDTDNYLQISYDGGLSFGKEGDWGSFTPPVYGDSCSAIVLDKDYPGHTGSANRIFVQIASGDLGAGGGTVGVAQADFNAGAVYGNPWVWTPLGDQATLPATSAGGGLVRDDTGRFFAVFYGAGVYMLPSGANPQTAWTSLSIPGNWFPAPPVGWKTSRIARDASTGRLYVVTGFPYTNGTQPANEAGIWESTNNGATWTRISDSNLDVLTVSMVFPNGPNTLLAAASDDGINDPTLGGVYRGVRGAGGGWTWTRTLVQPRVTSIAISPADNSLYYAFAAQRCCYQMVDNPAWLAGVWKSTDGGVTWGSAPLANDGLMDLGHSRLTFSEVDPHLLYSSSTGAGVFEGTIACDDPLRDNECSTRLNPSFGQVVNNAGAVESGTLSDIRAGSLDDTQEVLVETGITDHQHLVHVWSIGGANPAVSYELVVEAWDGYIDEPEGFNVSVATRASGNCTGSETYGGTVLAVSKTADDDLTQKATLGYLPAGATVFCVKVNDTVSFDSSTDRLHVDRLYLHAVQPGTPLLAQADYQTINGSITNGSYLDTRTSNDLYEVLKEAKVGPKVILNHIWRFPTAPAAGSYLLHLEGNSDAAFQFAYSTDGTNFTNIAGAILNVDPDIPGGTDYVFGAGGLSGTLYIRIKTVNEVGPTRHSAAIDHLTIRAVP